MLKKSLLISGLFGLTMLNLPAFAKSVLNIGENTIITAINGQEIRTGLFAEPKRQFHLEAGKHIITAKYTRLYELQGNNHDVLRSSNINLPIELADNQTYELNMVNQPEHYIDAKEYAKKPTLALLQQGKILVSQQASGNDGNFLSGLGKSVGGIFGGTSAIQTNQQAIQALQTETTATNTLDQFMQLWLKATPQEREKIRQWIQE